MQYSDRLPGLRGSNRSANVVQRHTKCLVTNRLPPLLRAGMYALRGGFLVRPLLIAIALGLIGAVLSSLEESMPILADWVPTFLFPSRADPQVAQTGARQRSPHRS